MGGELSPVGLLLMVLCGVVSLLLGRHFSRRWRARQQQKDQAARLASETRQQRRARERSQAKRD